MGFANDPNLYLSIPTRTPAGTLSLARAILGAAPEQPHPAVNVRLVRVHDRAGDLQGAWIAANLPGPDKSSRDYDLALDRSWRAANRRLHDWIDADHPAEAERAATLLARVFPTGLDFLRLRYSEQWAESDRRLQLIADGDLEDELVDLVDGRIVAKLKADHEAYGRVLGITEKLERPEAGRVAETLAALRTELLGLARLVLGLTDEGDPEAVAAAEAQLEPILRFRKSRGGGEGEGEGEEEEPIDAPLPEPPSSE